MGLTKRAGPWDSEPDHDEFTHDGLRCVIQRAGPRRHLCGYVEVKPGHPWHGITYEYDEPVSGVRVHGGLTWARDHAPGVDKNESTWLGFDCGHLGDVGNVDEDPYRLHYEQTVYRDIDYVRDQCRYLAAQIVKAGEVAKRETAGVCLTCRR